jgi:hypothetical protein
MSPSETPGPGELLQASRARACACTTRSGERFSFRGFPDGRRRPLQLGAGWCYKRGSKLAPTQSGAYGDKVGELRDARILRYPGCGNSDNGTLEVALYVIRPASGDAPWRAGPWPYRLITNSRKILNLDYILAPFN